MNSGWRIIGLVVGGIVILNSCSGNSKPTNFSAEGACNSLESLINQIGRFEINDANEFYVQMESIASQASNAAEIDSKYSEMASQVSGYLSVLQEKYPGSVPNYFGMIPMQVTSDEFCGTNYSEG